MRAYITSYIISYINFIFICTVPCNGSCQNGGTCTFLDVCACAPGWTGTNCEIGNYIHKNVNGITSQPLH